MTSLSILRLSLLLAASVVPSASSQAAQPSSAGVDAATLDPAARKAVIQAAIDRMNQRYVFPDKVPVIAKALRAALASGSYDAISEPKAFVRAVNKDIAAVANDRHLHLIWSAEPLPPIPEPGKIDPVMKQMQDAFLASRNYAMPKAEILDGNIGYLKIDGFIPPEDAGPTLAAAMAFLKHSEAMIVDLRDNGGGDPAMVAMAMSYFVPPETLINTFHQRGKTVDDQVWSLPFVPGGRWSTEKPVYVLTSARTASGGEEMAYDVQQLKRGTVIGESTWGGANPGEVIPIDAHFAIFVPSGMAVNPVSKTNWEGVGVKPDVAVASAEALDTARHLALEKLVADATGPRRDELQKLLDGKDAD